MAFIHQKSWFLRPGYAFGTRLPDLDLIPDFWIWIQIWPKRSGFDWIWIRNTECQKIWWLCAMRQGVESNPRCAAEWVDGFKNLVKRSRGLRHSAESWLCAMWHSADSQLCSVVRVMTFEVRYYVRVKKNFLTMWCLWVSKNIRRFQKYKLTLVKKMHLKNIFSKCNANLGLFQFFTKS
jgi:hypothetical protein